MSPCIFIELFARLSPEKKLQYSISICTDWLVFYHSNAEYPDKIAFSEANLKKLMRLCFLFKEYDAERSFYFRHQAFFHLYWGLNDLALQNGWKAFQTRPFYLKNFFRLLLIVFRIGGFLFSRGINKKPYYKLICAD